MARSRLVLIGYIFATLSTGFASAQTRLPVPQQPHSKPVPAGAQFGVSPFALESRSQDKLRILPAQQMAPADVQLLARSQSALQKQADLFDLGYKDTGWSVSQLVCPEFPNHLFLRMERNNGLHDVTIFSASIPRDGSGRVRIIPVLRRSATPFTPASRNPVSIAAFNKILTEEKAVPKPYWVDIATCYAALLGAQTGGAATASDAAGSGGGWHAAPVLSFGTNTEVMHLFTSQPSPLTWRLVFDTRGKLLEADATPALERISVPERSSR